MKMAEKRIKVKVERVAAPTESQEQWMNDNDEGGCTNKLSISSRDK